MKMRMIVLAASLSGCVALAQLAQKSSGGGPTGPDGARHVQIDGYMYRVGPYWGPDCERIGAQKERVYTQTNEEPHGTMGKQPNLSHPVADQIYRLVCVERILGGVTEPERNTWVVQHFRFDELYFDHFTAAMMLVQCLKAESCLDEGAPPERDDVKYPTHYERGPRSVGSYYQVAMMRWYADHVDPAEVQKRLQAVAVPPEAKQAFLDMFNRARTRVVEVSNELAPDVKKLFVDLPAEVYAQRAKERAHAAKLIADLGTQIERLKTERETSVSDDLVAHLRKLRVDYRASCSKECTKDVVFATITKQLFWAYVARGDSPAAMAEAKLLEKLDKSAAEDIADKQEAAIGKARSKLQRISSARDQGIDEDTARSTARGKVFDLDDGRYVYAWNSEFAISWQALVPEAGELAVFEGKIAAIATQGGTATIRFSDEVSSVTESTGCYETGRVDSISSDGHINYRQECTGESTHYDRRKVDPVMVPAVEIAGLHAGDKLNGFARLDDKHQRVAGRIWFVERGNRVARVRDVPL